MDALLLRIETCRPPSFSYLFELGTLRNPSVAWHEWPTDQFERIEAYHGFKGYQNQRSDNDNPKRTRPSFPSCWDCDSNEDSTHVATPHQSMTQMSFSADTQSVIWIHNFVSLSRLKLVVELPQCVHTSTLQRGNHCHAHTQTLGKRRAAGG